MTIDKLGCYNSALRIMGERKLANLSENRESRRVLDGVWDEDAVRYCLEQGQWQWASRSIKLEASDSVAPEFGYAYAFERPDDYVRTVQIATDEYFSNSLNQFTDESGYFFADVNILYLKFVSDDPEYGRDFSLWTPTFQRFVCAYLAYEASLRLTNSHAIQDRLELLVKKRLSDAQAKDGVNRPTMFPPTGTFVNARHGRNNRYDYRRR